MNLKELHRRGNIGRIELHQHTLFNLEEEVAKAVFSEFIVVKAEANPLTNVIEYWCISSKFREVEAGLEPPIYDVIVENEEDRPLRIEFKEREW